MQFLGIPKFPIFFPILFETCVFANFRPKVMQNCPPGHRIWNACLRSSNPKVFCGFWVAILNVRWGAHRGKHERRFQNNGPPLIKPSCFPCWAWRVWIWGKSVKMRKNKEGNDKKRSPPDHTKPTGQDSHPQMSRGMCPRCKEKGDFQTIPPSLRRVSL